MYFQRLIALGWVIIACPSFAAAGTQYIALAIGKSNHLGAGLGWYQSSRESAEADALASCRQSIPDGDCKIVLSGANTCISLHLGIDGSTWGAAMRSTRTEAQLDSLADCGGSEKCYILNSWCIEQPEPPGRSISE